MSKYFLPCSACGAQITIDVGQAGQTVSCECGSQVEVPTMRGIQKLARADEPQPQRAEWSPRQGIMFAAGLALTVIGAGFCGYILWERSKVDTSRPVDRLKSEFAANVDGASLDELWIYWVSLRDHQLSQPEVPQHRLNRQYAQRLLVMAIITGSVAVAGICLLVAAFVVRPKQASAKSKQGRPAKRGPTAT